MNAVDFASLLCSRLCHDLMSPVGALNNGIELLADETDPEMREKCLELLSDSARASANKLKFFRLAFGAAGGFGEFVDTHEAQAALEGLFGAERRIELGWVVSDGKLPKGAVKAPPGVGGVQANVDRLKTPHENNMGRNGRGSIPHPCLRLNSGPFSAE